MSINVDKLDAKNENPRKTKSTVKRRRKISLMSGFSSGSLSPTKRNLYSNNYVEENPSSAESSPRVSPFPSTGAFNDLFRYSYPQSEMHTITMPTTSSTIQSDNKLTDGDDQTDEYSNEFNVQQNGSMRNFDTQTTKQQLDSSSNHNGTDSDSNASVNKGKRRTTEDFYLFCQFILEYENYNEIADQEALRDSTHSPLDSTGSATESTTSSAVIEEEKNEIANIETSKTESVKDMDVSNSMDETKLTDTSKNASAIDISSTNDDVTDESDIDAESYNLITCYCGKPYAARPMIECSQCLTWLHLSCAKVKRKHIPDIFICVKCVKNTHPKDLQGNEKPKENNRLKRSSASRADKLENNILQPLNVGAAYETAANSLENIKTSSTPSITVKYK